MISHIDASNGVHYVRFTDVPGRRDVTVRRGGHGVYCCLTCLTVTCEHVRAAKRYDTAPAAGADIYEGE